MTKKKMLELRDNSIADLEFKASQLRGELAKELAQKSAGTRPENPGKIRKTKREIARILTIVREKKKAKREKK